MWDVAAGRYFEFMKALLHEDEDEDEDAETPRETNADMVLHKIKVRPHDWTIYDFTTSQADSPPLYNPLSSPLLTLLSLNLRCRLSSQLVQVATRFTLGTLAEARSEERMRQWAEGLLTWYEACPQAREWLLAIFAAQEENLLRDVIMEVRGPRKSPNKPCMLWVSASSQTAPKRRQKPPLLPLCSLPYSPPSLHAYRASRWLAATSPQICWAVWRSSPVPSTRCSSRPCCDNCSSCAPPSGETADSGTFGACIP